MSKLAPIVLFVYNRPWHTEQTLNSLSLNNLASESTLYIYADGPKANATGADLAKINDTREIIRKKKWCKEVHIIESAQNKGLANSIIAGVSAIVNQYSKVVVLEDDLVTSPFFLTYINRNLDLYEHTENVISVHGFMYPIKKQIDNSFFLRGADCWGWGTWKRGWDLFEHDAESLLKKIESKHLSYEFNFNDSYNYTGLLSAQVSGEIDSWAIRWYASAFLANKLTLYPPFSLVNNIGFDGSGSHKDIINEPEVRFDFTACPAIGCIEAKENKKVKQLIITFFRGKGYLLRKVKSVVKTILRWKS